MRRIHLLLLLAGCGYTAPGPASPAAAEPPPPETGGERMGDQHPTGGSEIAPGADAGPGASANEFDVCVKECVRQRQMQAVSMEKIEADCQGECAAK